MAGRWPVVLRHDLPPGAPMASIVLRPLRRRDAAEWDRLRGANIAWLAPWEPMRPPGNANAGRWPCAPTFGRYVARLNRQGRAGEGVPLAMEVDGALAGQIMVGSLEYGSQLSGVIGYWVSQEVAGRGIAPLATGMLIDFLLGEYGLHRIEICIRPENAASLRVVAKLGLRSEGIRPRLVFIAGQWRDHIVFAIDSEEWLARGPFGPRWDAWPPRYADAE
ncbi:GNAT family N-acetyltransferase [Rarobacter incanus]|uniref:Ribosomal-protein-alanine N-acetyltransferase n=1 Tax=Rarobacter incanus TaxID=153494 RepID=A0A542SPW4_9MICO|nr:GNAT family protein [Rarobacter incanus]TQK76307.1 ribosomal-protein-alanine N-acetyltransferase [Rarobacter incanus]